MREQRSDSDGDMPWSCWHRWWHGQTQPVVTECQMTTTTSLLTSWHAACQTCVSAADESRTMMNQTTCDRSEEHIQHAASHEVTHTLTGCTTQPGGHTNPGGTTHTARCITHPGCITLTGCITQPGCITHPGCITQPGCTTHRGVPLTPMVSHTLMMTMITAMMIINVKIMMMTAMTIIIMTMTIMTDDNDNHDSDRWQWLSWQ